MRIVKEGEERRNEILDRAMELFSTRGYEQTSTTDIMEAVGIAKGTLYYHFSSKEEILDALIDRVSREAVTRAQAVLDRADVGVYDKFLQLLLSIRVTPDRGGQLVEELHRPQNALMHQKTLRVLLTEIAPLLAQIIEEGNEQGEFHALYPLELAEMFLCYGNVIFDEGYFDLTPEEAGKKAVAMTSHLGKLLGADEGKLQKLLAIYF